IAKITTRCPLSSGSLAELVFHATAERKIRYYLESLATITKNLWFVRWLAFNVKKTSLFFERQVFLPRKLFLQVQ
ncbi:hypothetical protein COW94_04790, partial [Candidatus Peregrinibacteria bacterium CG22_combo_CG10-13_8_21_14_all_44_10]